MATSNRTNHRHRPTTSAVAGLAAVTATAALWSASPASAVYPANAVTVVSSSANGIGQDTSHSPAITDDGRFVAFTSWANNLVPGDTNDNADTFVRDTVSGAIERVSVMTGSTGQLDGVDSGARPDISADGRYVTFVTDAADVVPGDTNNAFDVFRRDRTTGVAVRVSVGNGGLQAGADSRANRISPDGGFVAFDTQATNLGGTVTGFAQHIYLRNIAAATTTPVTVTPSGALSQGWAHVLSVSSTGRFIAFVSDANDLVAADNNDKDDVFVRDMQTGTTKLVSTSATGALGNDHVNYSSGDITPDGRYVLFSSRASNLVAGDSNSVGDAFVKDTVTGNVELISRTTWETPIAGESVGVDLSNDGRLASFVTDASNVTWTHDANTGADVFIRDRLVQTTALVSSVPDGSRAAGADSGSFGSALAGSRNAIVFTSLAADLVAAADGGATQIFQRAFTVDTTAPVERVTVTSSDPSLDQLWRALSGVVPQIQVIEPDRAAQTFQPPGCALLPLPAPGQAYLDMQTGNAYARLDGTVAPAVPGTCRPAAVSGYASIVPIPTA